MVFIISIAVIVAFIVGYFVVTKTPRQSGKPVNTNDDLKPVPPPSRDDNYRPKY